MARVTLSETGGAGLLALSEPLTQACYRDNADEVAATNGGVRPLGQLDVKRQRSATSAVCLWNHVQLIYQSFFKAGFLSLLIQVTFRRHMTSWMSHSATH